MPCVVGFLYVKSVFVFFFLRLSRSCIDLPSSTSKPTSLLEGEEGEEEEVFPHAPVMNDACLLTLENLVAHVKESLSLLPHSQWRVTEGENAYRGYGRSFFIK